MTQSGDEKFPLFCLPKTPRLSWGSVEVYRRTNIHMYVKIPPKMSVSGFMGFLKGKSSVIIYQKFGNLKFKYRNREFWCRGYYVDTVGKNTKKIKEYIANQLSEDKRMEQMSLSEVNDPFAKDKPVR